LDLVSSSWTEYIFLVGGVVLLLTVIGNPDGQAIVIGDQLQAIASRVRLGAKRTEGSVTVPPAATLQAASAVAPPAAAPAARRLQAAERHELTVDEVTVRFGGIVALSDVSFTVGTGEVLAIIGPNGAGKTTLIDALTGFVKVAYGTVTLDGRNVTRALPCRRARAGLGRSFQSLELFEDLTVAENLMVAEDDHDLGAYFRDLVRPRRKATSDNIEVVLDTLGLSADRDSLPRNLGYGQRRLLAVGRAVVGLPGILFLDEPCAGLDAHERDEIGQLVRKLVEQTGMSVVLVEHDVDLVRRVADRVIALDFGQVIAAGPPDAVFRDARVVAAYLGVDEAQPVTAGVSQ
jgi:ABC-type branched-subunit amino acid transport system ATPase component